MSGGDPWHFLRGHTDARVALGRAGNGLPTEEVLAFQLGHAQARDAVYTALDADVLRRQLDAAEIKLPVVEVASRAGTRADFLQRPDLGRQLEDAGELKGAGPCDVVFVLADGLSARALHAHGADTLAATLRHLEGWQVGPVVLAHQARVALADPVGEALAAQLSVILIGERPGLSAADSLGAYLTYAPKTGRQNAQRNCVSNIRTAGLAPDAAGHKLAYLLKQAKAMGLSGVALKDDAPAYLSGDAFGALPRG